MGPALKWIKAKNIKFWNRMESHIKGVMEASLQNECMIFETNHMKVHCGEVLGLMTSKLQVGT